MWTTPGSSGGTWVSWWAIETPGHDDEYRHATDGYESDVDLPGQTLRTFFNGKVLSGEFPYGEDDHQQDQGPDKVDEERLPPGYLDERTVVVLQDEEVYTYDRGLVAEYLDLVDACVVLNNEGGDGAADPCDVNTNNEASHQDDVKLGLLHIENV